MSKNTRAFVFVLMVSIVLCFSVLFGGCSGYEAQIEHTAEQVRLMSCGTQEPERPFDEALAAKEENSLEETAPSEETLPEEEIIPIEEPIPKDTLQRYLEKKDIWLPADEANQAPCWLADLDSDGTEELVVTEYHETVPYTTFYSLRDDELCMYSCQYLTQRLVGFAPEASSLRYCEAENERMWMIDAEIVLLDGTVGTGLLKLIVREADLGTVLELTALTFEADGSYYINIGDSLEVVDQTQWESYQSSLPEGIRYEAKYITDGTGEMTDTHVYSEERTSNSELDANNA